MSLTLLTMSLYLPEVIRLILSNINSSIKSEGIYRYLTACVCKSTNDRLTCESAGSNFIKISSDSEKDAAFNSMLSISCNLLQLYRSGFLLRLRSSGRSSCASANRFVLSISSYAYGLNCLFSLRM